MEEVLAMTAKLQLPVPLRERIHEYYEHLWHEYECLDGEIVQFSKSLSHSLGLEVVLFKYMEVVMHVPFWKDCTPDFQKQLMLHLDVRVYLPNDFIMRQGEVDVEFYMVNRGYCELDRDSNRFERVTTTTLATGRNGFNIGRSNSMTARRRSVVMNATQMNDTTRQSAYELDAAQRRYYLNGGRDGKGTEILISRGQAFGDMALLMNYQRAANVRAVTHVEMCVLAREKFQTVLAKYPEDRRRVVVDMLTSYMQSYEVSKSHCPLLELVRKVYSPEAIAKACAQAGTSPPLAPPALTVRQAAERIYTAINKESNDPTLKFGVGVNIRDKLLELRERRRKKRGQTQQKRTEIPKTESRNRESSSHFDRVGRNYSETKTAVVETSTMEAPTDPNLTHTTTSSSLQHRLQQLEEREVVILQGLKDLQASLEVLRSRPTTTTHFSRKRLAPGDDSTTTKPPRIPLLRRVGSFVASGGNPDTKSQGQGGKDSPTRYADKLFGSQNVAKDREPPRYQISRPNDSFRLTSEIEPPLSTIESLPVDQPPRDVVVSDRGNTVASERHPASFQPTEEVVSLDNNPRILFQRMASRSLRKLEVAVQSRSDAKPVARASIAERRATFQRTHSQSLRTMADALKPQQRPRPSMTSTQTRVLKRMSSFVSEGQLSNKRSPTRYADELFRRKSMMAPDEEGWEPK